MAYHYITNSDDIVRRDRQYPWPHIIPEDMSNPINIPNNLDTTCIIANSLPPFHTKVQEKINKIMRGLDEPNFREVAYETKPNNGLINGFITYSRNYLQTDYDWFKFKSDVTGQATFEIYDMPNTNYWVVEVWDQNLNAITNITNNSQTNSVLFDVSQDQYYYVWIDSQATEDSWQSPYKFRINTQPLITANFASSSTSIIPGQNVLFEDNSTGTPTSWQWAFEGGTPATSTLQNPTVAYNTAGTFDVTLTVSDGINTSDPLTKQDYITVQNAVTGGLVAYYPFNGNANDESGNGNIGNVDGATPTTDRFGNANSAYNFDGSNDQIVVSPQQILKDFPAGNHTYSVWINPSSSPSNVKMVIDCAGWGSGGDQRGIRFHGRPTPIFKWVTNVSSYMTESTIGLTTNNWYHIVGVLEGNTGRIYVNGALTGTATSSGQPTGITYFKIGNVSVGGTGDLYYHGKIDDIMLFNRALSASEISSLYNQSTPCPGTPTVTYEGQVYNTVKIGNQCWIRENLNVGTKIPGTTNQSNNQLIEKYCYNNDLANCASYGGLYQWDEMMQYSSQEGTQGICPTGWHIPSDQEWCTLTTFIDPTVSCNSTDWTGTNVGFKMKSTNGWISNGNGSDIFGFTAVPNGDRDAGGGFPVLV